MECTLNFQCSENCMSVIAHIFPKLLTPKDVLIKIHHRDCFWKHFRSELVNESQKLLKPPETYFFPTFSSFWAKLSFKKLFLISSEILGVLVNTLSVNYEYSRSNRGNLALQIEIKLSKKPQNFLLDFLFIFWILYYIANVLKKKMSVIGQIFLNLLTTKDVLI